MDGWKAEYYVPLLFFENAEDNKMTCVPSQKSGSEVIKLFYAQLCMKFQLLMKTKL